MKLVEPDTLMGALAEALETMAFIAVDPSTVTDPDAAAVPLHVSLTFTGPLSGQLTICAPTALGTLIAANLCAAQPDAIGPQHAADALRELANVTAGLLLRQMCDPDDMPHLAIPLVSERPAPMGPHSYCLASLCADGHPVTAALRIDS